MLQPRKLSGLVVAVVPTVLLLIGSAFAINASNKYWPGWLTSDWPIIERETMLRGGWQLTEAVKSGALENQPYGLLLGSSTIDFGVDREQLERTVPSPNRWVRLTGHSATTCELARLAQLAFAKGLRPTDLLLGIDLRMLVRNPTFRDPNLAHAPVDLTKVQNDLKSLRLKNAWLDCERLVGNAFNGIFFEHSNISSRVTARLTDARAELLDNLGQNFMVYFSTSHPEDFKPWVIPGGVDNLKEQEILALKDKGAFDPRSYSGNGITYDALALIIRLARSESCRVTILLMPESSLFRSHMPSQAQESLRQFLTTNFGIAAPQVHDYVNAIPDSGFIDCYHMNEKGQREFTERLARDMQKSLREVPSRDTASR